MFILFILSLTICFFSLRYLWRRSLSNTAFAGDVFATALRILRFMLIVLAATICIAYFLSIKFFGIIIFSSIAVAVITNLSFATIGASVVTAILYIFSGIASSRRG